MCATNESSTARGHAVLLQARPSSYKRIPRPKSATSDSPIGGPAHGLNVRYADAPLFLDVTADAVLRICANSINGLSNRYGGRGERDGDPRYQELLVLMREAQNQGDLVLFSENAQDQAVKLGLRQTSDVAAEARNRRIANLLGLDGITGEFNVVYGARPLSHKEIAIQSRSMMQVLIDLGSYIDVPARDITEGRVFVAPRNDQLDRLFPALLRVHSSESAPQDAHVAVRYRNGWFYIDDRDHESKAAFNFLMLLFSLTETGTTQAAPIVTVPAR